MNTESTPALELADYLLSLAEHLQAHSHLPRVIIHTGQGIGPLQIGSSKDEAEHLHTWYSSLGNRTVAAHPWFDDCRDAYVEVTGTLEDGTKVRVWNKVPNMGVACGYDKTTPKRLEPIADSVLVDFALTSEEAA